MRTRDDRALLDSLRRPDGWFTIGLVLLVCATLAWSLDDALLVLGQDQLTDFLFWAAMGGAAIGLIGPLVGWGRWRTYAVGAVFAALLVPLLVGWALRPEGGSAATLFQATTDEVVRAFSDLIVLQLLFTPAYGHHLLVLGLITWGTAQFASYATFGHRRPINAVVVIGLLLIANMSLTVRPQLTFMVIFSIASLFLLVRFHTLDEQADWLRRRIGDPTAISALYLRGGTVFIIAAITASLALTAGAKSAPLAGAWTGVAARVVDWGQFLQRFLPVAPNANGLGPSFTDNSTITSTWNTSPQEQLRIDFPVAEDSPPFLAAVYYDQFQLRGWTSTQGTQVTPDGAADVLAGTAEDVNPDGHRTLVATITPLIPRREVFTPGLPTSISSPVRLHLTADAGYLTGIDRDVSDAAYTVTTLVEAPEGQGGLTQERLRAAGTDYPADVVSLYGKATLPPEAMGPESQKLLQQIVQAAPNTDPYDLASAIERTLRDNNQFEYDTDLTDNRCDDPSVVECFALTRHGFCQYYASMMTVFLRELDIPARYVQGFLPGKPDPVGNSRTVRSSDSHAWVQAYFPGYGWIDFDPTGGPVDERPQLAPIPSGVPQASGTAKPSGAASTIPERPDPTDRAQGGPGGSIDRTAGGPPVGLFIGITILLAVVVGSIAAVAWRRSPNGPVSPNDVYGSVSRLATRLGFGPRPNQTVYEYAGALGDELPMLRPELETVAHAKVEVAYGGRTLADDRLGALRAAHRRLRLQLFRLVPRRRRRRGRVGRSR
ncbi:MAG: transglutaminase domain-containing protein [Chloroflexota bacterium]